MVSVSVDTSDGAPTVEQQVDADIQAFEEWTQEKLQFEKLTKAEWAIIKTFCAFKLGVAKV
jgi:lipoate-protein ligase A